MKALKNLPRTLDETYDRVFAIIPKEERLIVHHVLGWIAHHNELYEEDGMPCEILIQAVEVSSVELTGEQNERFYDKDTLREICGCLIEISSRDVFDVDKNSLYTYASVTFAHYTVLEYLESGRIFTSAFAYHDAVEKPPRELFLEITFSEAQNVKSENLLTADSEINPAHDIQAVYSNFSDYCMISGILSLYKWPELVCRQKELQKLVVDFLDPSKPHFETTVMRTFSLNHGTHFFPFKPARMYSESKFWDVEWDSQVGTDARHLYLLLLLYEWREVYEPLVRSFVQENDHKRLLQSRLTFWKWGEVYPLCRRAVDPEVLISDGSIFEIFAQRYSRHVHLIPFLTEIGTELFDPTVALLLSISGHDHEGDCSTICAVQRLLELGANPNLTGYIVTPLQIATYRMDFEGASILLENGAHSSSTGCIDGVVWEKDTIMSYLNHLHGASPLRIIRKYTYITPQINSSVYPDWIPGVRQKLEKLLLQYGAEEISATPQAAMEEVRYDALEWREWAKASPQTQARSSSKIDVHPPDSSADKLNITENNSLSRSYDSSNKDALPAFLTTILN